MLNQAHNGYLDILAQLGIVGLILTTLFLMVTLFRLVRLVADARGPIMFIAIYTTIGIIIYNITEFSLLRSGSSVWLYFLLVVSSALMTRAPSGNDRYGASGSKRQGTRSTITRRTGPAVSISSSATRMSLILPGVRRITAGRPKTSVRNMTFGVLTTARGTDNLRLRPPLPP